MLILKNHEFINPHFLSPALIHYCFFILLSVIFIEFPTCRIKTEHFLFKGYKKDKGVCISLLIIDDRDVTNN